MEWLFIDMGSTFVDEEKCDNCRIMETLHHEKAPSNDIVQSSFKFYRNMNINSSFYGNNGQPKTFDLIFEKSDDEQS